jgi:hypothetical protein
VCSCVRTSLEVSCVRCGREVQPQIGLGLSWVWDSTFSFAHLKLELLAGQPQSPDGFVNERELILALEGARPFLTPEQHLRASCSQDGTWRAVRAWVLRPR